MGVKTRVLVTSNVLNVFFAALNLVVLLLLLAGSRPDQATTFGLIAACHLLLVLYVNRQRTIWKRVATMSLANLTVFLLGFALPEVQMVQVIFSILLIGLNFLIFNARQRMCLLAGFLVPFVHLIWISVGFLQDLALPPVQLQVYTLLIVTGAFGIATGLGVVVFKVRQIENLLRDLMGSDGQQAKKGPGHSYFSYSHIKRIKDNLDEKEGFYKLLASYSKDIILLCDSEGTITYLSPSVEKILGYEPAELIGSSISLVTGSEFSDPSESQFTSNFTVRTKDGREIWLEGNVQRICDAEGQHVQTHAVLRDITERKLAEEQLQEAKKRAEEASLAKERFLSTMTHEIRTPLNAVIGMSKILLEESPRADQLDLLKTLHYSAENLLTLINDILDFTKMSMEKIEFEEVPFKLADEVEKMAASLKFKAGEKGNVICFEASENLPLLVKGDLHRLRQVLTNLIGNAAKFTENGVIKISCQLLRTEKGKQWVRFSVADNGIGIAADKLHTIFEEFNQADPAISRKYGGTGLGLAICKAIVEQQGGRIWAESKKNEGACFYFDLPFARAQAFSEKPEGVSLLAPLGDLHVLAVDDNEINQLVLERFLKKWNVSFKQAANGQEAILAASSEHFDLVLMDLEMPLVDGYTAAREIRAESSINAETPIVALTASTRNEVEDKITAAGMNDVMMKPFNPEKLHQVLLRFSRNAKGVEQVA